MTIASEKPEKISNKLAPGQCITANPRESMKIPVKAIKIICIKQRYLIHPIRNEHIGVACSTVVAIAAPSYLFAIGTEHDKAIKLFVVSHLLQPRAVHIDHKNIERKTYRAFVIAAK